MPRRKAPPTKDVTRTQTSNTADDPAPRTSKRRRKAPATPTHAPALTTTPSAPVGWAWSKSSKAEAESKYTEAWFDSYCKSEQMRHYMHTEWGFEKRGDAPLFEKICLEGAQAGLSWATILAKGEAYRKAFKGPTTSLPRPRHK